MQKAGAPREDRRREREWIPDALKYFYENMHARTIAIADTLENVIQNIRCDMRAVSVVRLQTLDVSYVKQGFSNDLFPVPGVRAESVARVPSTGLWMGTSFLNDQLAKECVRSFKAMEWMSTRYLLRVHAFL